MYNRLIFTETKRAKKLYQLITRYYTQNAELIRNLDKYSIISREQSNQLYHEIKSLYAELKYELNTFNVN